MLRRLDLPGRTMPRGLPPSTGSPTRPGAQPGKPVPGVLAGDQHCRLEQPSIRGGLWCTRRRRGRLPERDLRRGRDVPIGWGAGELPALRLQRRGDGVRRELYPVRRLRRLRGLLRRGLFCAGAPAGRVRRALLPGCLRLRGGRLLWPKLGVPALLGLHLTGMRRVRARGRLGRRLPRDGPGRTLVHRAGRLRLWVLLQGHRAGMPRCLPRVIAPAAHHARGADGVGGWPPPLGREVPIDPVSSSPEAATGRTEARRGRRDRLRMHPRIFGDRLRATTRRIGAPRGD